MAISIPTAGSSFAMGVSLRLGEPSFGDISRGLKVLLSGQSCRVCLWTTRSSQVSLGLQQRFDGAALVHSAVAFRDLIERQSQIENLARVNLSIQHQLDQFRQVASYRSRPTVEVDVGEE